MAKESNLWFVIRLAAVADVNSHSWNVCSSAHSPIHKYLHLIWNCCSTCTTYTFWSNDNVLCGRPTDDRSHICAQRHIEWNAMKKKITEIPQRIDWILFVFLRYSLRSRWMSPYAVCAVLYCWWSTLPISRLLSSGTTINIINENTVRTNTHICGLCCAFGVLYIAQLLFHKFVFIDFPTAASQHIKYSITRKTMKRWRSICL